MTPKNVSFDTLTAIARSCDLEIVGVLRAHDAQNLLDQNRQQLDDWQKSGWAAEMGYMQRSPNLLTDLKNLLPEVVTVVSFVVPYSTRADLRLAKQGCPQGSGRVARYAWGRDYHKILPKRMKRFVKAVEAEFGSDPSFKWRIFSDAVPLLERALVAGASLGFIGKNTMLIRPGLGSFTFLCEVLWEIDVELPVQRDESRGSCGSCSRCIEVCPTKALVGPRQLDASKCISYLTIEKRGDFSDWEQEALGEWLFGCDLCQEVCPFNHDGLEIERLVEFGPEVGPGPFLDLEELLGIRDRVEFLDRFAGTPLMRPGREGLLRNAACVAANTKAFRCIEPLISSMKEDSSALVRRHARWALERLEDSSDGLDRSRLRQALAAQTLVEPCPDE